MYSTVGGSSNPMRGVTQNMGDTKKNCPKPLPVVYFNAFAMGQQLSDTVRYTVM